MPRSVIVPAHNEAAVIGPTLEALLDGLDDGTIVVVVCNGCTDSTVAVADRFSPKVRVVEIPVASKIGALNAAEAVLPAGSKAFVDADVQISGKSINYLFAGVAGPSGLASEPEVRFDLDGSSFLVRSYYRVWVALHGARPGDVGGGVYCLSEAARRRFGVFPDVISDDGFVRAHFGSGEMMRVTDAVSTVRVPRDLTTLLKIKTRSRRGTAELATRFPELWEAKVKSTDSLARKIRRLPLKVWPSVPVYLMVQLLVRFRARGSRNDSVWERDETSRSAS